MPVLSLSLYMWLHVLSTQCVLCSKVTELEVLGVEKYLCRNSYIFRSVLHKCLSYIFKSVCFVFCFAFSEVFSIYNGRNVFPHFQSFYAPSTHTHMSWSISHQESGYLFHQIPHDHEES